MKAVLRWTMASVAAVLLIGPAPALAQSVPPATTNTPASDAIGPRDLQDFSLKGTVTRPAEPPPQARAAAPVTRNQPPSAPASTAPRQPNASAGAQPKAPEATASVAVRQARPPTVRAPESIRQTPPASSVTVALPSFGGNPAASSSAVTGPAADASPASAPFSPRREMPLLPWLLAALALGAGGAFLFWRNRTREAFVGGPGNDAFVAPEPARAPVPQPPRATVAPAPAPRHMPPEPSIPGTVTTRLRPWIEIGFHPGRFVVEDNRVAIDFELELFNSGNAPARAVLVEAKLVNAGAGQDAELGAFFANPVGEGERVISIPPLKRMTIKSQVAVGREHVQVFEVAGRKVCVPLLALNALYGWDGGSAGQTSASYLLGRDTNADRLAPFRLDLGPRLFRGVGARVLPVGVRT